MDKQEAIKILKLNVICSPQATEFEKAVKLAITALEKQIKKKQVCVRTFPNGYCTTTDILDKYLNDGYIVVMCNTFYARDGRTGNEYILEKEVDKN